MDLFTAASTLWGMADNVRELHASIMNGSIYEVIVAGELQAAKECFARIPQTADKRGMLWSAVNHLQAAHSHLRVEHDGKRPAVLIGPQLFRARMAWTDQFTLCLLACTYHALGELPNSKECLGLAEMIDPGKFNPGIRAKLKSSMFWSAISTMRELKLIGVVSSKRPYQSLDVQRLRKSLALESA